MIRKLIDSKSHETNILNCIEEHVELIQAVTKYERYRVLGKYSKLPKLQDNVLEEIVDCKISLEILIEMFGFSKEDLQKKYDEKMKRNLERIEK